MTHSLSFAAISIFSPEINKFWRHQWDFITWPRAPGMDLKFYTSGKRVKTRIQNVSGAYCNVSRSFRGKTVRGLFTPPTLNMVKIKAFWHNGPNAIISYYDVTNKMSSLDSNYIVDVVMLQNSSIFMREVIKTWILQGFGKKSPTFFEGYSWFKFNTFRLALDMAPKFYTSVAKELKLKVWKFWGVEMWRSCTSYRGKFGRGSLLPPLITVCLE